jgi:hypothetical protein
MLISACNAILRAEREILKLPPLDGSDWLIKKETQSIHAKIWTDGYDSSQRKKFNSTMPSMGLSSQEVADVMNYIRNF